MQTNLQRPSRLETLYLNISFLVGALKNLGFKSGWKYWKAYLQCQKDPVKLIHWAKACKDEAHRIRTSNLKSTELAKLAIALEENADHLHRTSQRYLQICAWESIQMKDTDPKYANQLAGIEEELRTETNNY